MANSPFGRALGASRARLVQQLLTECVLLSSISAVAGLAVAVWTGAIAARLQPEGIVGRASILDGRVLAFGIAVATLCGVLFGIFHRSTPGGCMSWDRAGPLVRAPLG
ncbi:MAG: FtsX-like permease family protein [Ignavibacteriota bacterium]